MGTQFLNRAAELCGYLAATPSLEECPFPEPRTVLSLFKHFSFYFMRVDVLFARMLVHQCVQCLWKPEKMCLGVGNQT